MCNILHISFDQCNAAFLKYADLLKKLNKQKNLLYNHCKSILNDLTLSSEQEQRKNSFLQKATRAAPRLTPDEPELMVICRSHTGPVLSAPGKHGLEERNWMS